MRARARGCAHVSKASCLLPSHHNSATVRPHIEGLVLGEVGQLVEKVFENSSEPYNIEVSPAADNNNSNNSNNNRVNSVTYINRLFFSPLHSPT